jgi:hypothetical protein
VSQAGAGRNCTAHQVENQSVKEPEPLCKPLCSCSEKLYFHRMVGNENRKERVMITMNLLREILTKHYHGFRVGVEFYFSQRILT